MVIDLSDVTPLLTWLLGPGWLDGALFRPVVIALVLCLLLAGVIWAVAALRKGQGSTSRRGGAVIAGGLTAVMILVVAGAVSWAISAMNAAVAAKQAAGTGQPPAEPLLVSWVGKPLVQLLGSQWYQGALYQWLGVMFCAAGAVFLIGWLLTALRRGPVSAFVGAGQVAGDCALDLVRISPQRVGALARLAVKESIRRRVVVVLAVFVIILLFAGWYLDPSSTNPARLYLDFVFDDATRYPLLLLVLFLSSLSLPADIKNRTLHTVVTKPVRASEIVLGRIVGFTAVASILLVLMGVISYGFVVRGLAHTHEVELSSLKPAEAGVHGRPGGLEGRTTEVNKHRHHVTIDASGRGRVEPEQGHTHALITAKENGRDVYRLGPPIEELKARVPIYGKLTFLSEKGQPTDKGINVGDEWMYRSFIAGGSAAAAIWTFQGITEEAFPRGLPVDLTISVFRTYKGDIEKVVPGSLSIRNPKTGKTALVRIFDSKDREIDEQLVPRQWPTSNKKTVDLFRDFVQDGQVEIILQCASPQQYFGMAQGDMYLRAAEGSFVWNFIKGYLGIWLQVVLVVSLGVTYSTFLSGPVAMVATLGTLLGGFFHEFMYRLATSQTYGGGPFESIIRILTQQNQTSELEPGLRSTVAQGLDQVTEFFLRLITAVLPDVPAVQFFRVRRQRIQYTLRDRDADLRLPHARVRAAGVYRRLFVPEKP